MQEEPRQIILASTPVTTETGVQPAASQACTAPSTEASGLEVTPYTEVINLGSSPHQPPTKPRPELNSSTDDEIPDLISPFKRRKERKRLLTGNASKQLYTTGSSSLKVSPKVSVCRDEGVHETEEEQEPMDIVIIPDDDSDVPPSPEQVPIQSTETEERSQVPKVMSKPQEATKAQCRRRLRKAFKRLVAENAVVTLCKDGTSRLRLERVYGPGRINRKSSKVGSKFSVELEAGVKEDTKQIVSGLFKNVQITEVQEAPSRPAPRPKKFPAVRRPKRRPTASWEGSGP